MVVMMVWIYRTTKNFFSGWPVYDLPRDSGIYIQILLGWPENSGISRIPVYTNPAAG